MFQRFKRWLAYRHFRELLHIDEYDYAWIKTYENPRLKTKEDLAEIGLAIAVLADFQPTAEEYLRRHPESYPWAALWTSHGREFNPPSEKACEQRLASAGFMEDGECYVNALTAAPRL